MLPSNARRFSTMRFVVLAAVLAMSMTLGQPSARAAAVLNGPIAYVYGPDLFVAEQDGTGARDVSGATPSTDISPDWSADGRRLAWVSADGGWHLRVHDLVTAADSSLAFDTQRSGVSWHPDGDKLVYSASANGQAGLAQVSLAEPDGRVWLTSHPHDHEPDVSPDGSTLVFTRWDGPSPHLYRQALDPAGHAVGEPEALTSTSGAADQAPAWSPDGTYPSRS